MSHPDNGNLPVDDARALTDNAGVGLYILQDGRFRYVNEWMAKLLGCDGAGADR